MTRCKSTSSRAEKMAMAMTEMVNMSAGSCRKILDSDATIRMATPMTKNLCMVEKSRLLVVATLDMAPNTKAVQPNAIMISCEPLSSPLTWPNRQASQRTMNDVKANTK